MAFQRLNHKQVPPEGLLTASRNKYDSAKKLRDASKYADAVYLAGYALEFILKRHICLCLGWSEYPPKHVHVEGGGYRDDTNYQSFTTHDLNKLLILAGLHPLVADDSDLMSHWETVLKWQVELRYCSPDDLQKEAATEIMESILHMIKWVIQKHD
jgi:hypothetical protein